MNPRYSSSRRAISSAVRTKILDILGNNPTRKQIEQLAQQHEIKPVTIKAWLKNQSISWREKSLDSESEQLQPSVKKKVFDQSLLDFEQNFNNDSEYHYAITNKDILESQQQQSVETKKPPTAVKIPQNKASTPVTSVMPQLPNIQRPEKITLQNFEALLLLLDSDDEIHSLVTLLRKQELQIEEIKKTQRQLLEFFCSHLSKKQGKTT